MNFYQLRSVSFNGYFVWGEHLYLFCILVSHNKWKVKNAKEADKKGETIHLFIFVTTPYFGPSTGRPTNVSWKVEINDS